MFDKLEVIEKRFIELEHLLADYESMQDKDEYQSLAKELSGISKIVSTYRDYKKTVAEIDSLENVLKEKHETDFLSLAKEELSALIDKKSGFEGELRALLDPAKQVSNKEVIFEIRAGTGGQEASLFAEDLYRMYAKYAAAKGWQVEHIESHPTELGGFKEVIFSVSGRGAYEHLHFESGVHRVQRVPATEASGRIHTSTATVVVMVEPEEVELKIDPKDLRIDVYRSSGKGGQGVNKTDSAVRITHLPTNMVVTCQDERSQLKNKAKAMKVLRARLLDQISQEEERKLTHLRKSQIGTGDRSEKIRTYNFPEHRVADHRIGFTMHQLDRFMEGELDSIIEALIEEEARNERT
jgi:peptide chain release factor 1